MFYRCTHISIQDAIFEKMTDFERILADVHRKAEVLRAEIQHLKRLNEQLLTEKNRCIREIHDVASDAHTAVDNWTERMINDLNSRYEHDTSTSHEKQEKMVAKDRQLGIMILSKYYLIYGTINISKSREI